MATVRAPGSVAPNTAPECAAEMPPIGAGQGFLNRRVGGMVFGPDFRLVRALPSVPEWLIWADNAHSCQRGTTATPTGLLTLASWSEHGERYRWRP
jgi:hypothetical protein